MIATDAHHEEEEEDEEDNITQEQIADEEGKPEEQQGDEDVEQHKDEEAHNMHDGQANAAGANALFRAHGQYCGCSCTDFQESSFCYIYEGPTQPEKKKRFPRKRGVQEGPEKHAKEAESEC